MRCRVVLLFCSALVTAPTSSKGDTPESDESYLIRGVPHVQQKPDFCGEACVASWLQKLAINLDQDDVFEASGLDPTLGRGCYTPELTRAMRQIGFEPGPVWHRISAAEPANQLDELWGSILKDLREGIASIVCMRTSDGLGATEHFRLVVGFDANLDQVIYHEPAEQNGAYRRMPRTQFLNLWPLKYNPTEWLVIRFAMRVGNKPVVSSKPGFTAADYAQHIMRLKSRLPSDEFTVVVEYPFVVVGDESPGMVKRRAEQTVRWATTRLKREYFAKDPSQILDIWLFKDKSSYDTHVLRLFGDEPTTPYGYYSSAEGALVMNIATGGGTLVHEIVHPFIEANFPRCPAWFNEGLGSLYEQSSSRGERIVGLTNWRLNGLQRAIDRGQVPSFATLCSTTTNQFYRADPGTNYAQARYLCYYLQEQGLLGKFYHAFVANHASDPSGYATLKKVLAEDDMESFKRRCELYVMKLRFGNL